jgi:serine/threonine protein phosphatase PrpC
VDHRPEGNPAECARLAAAGVELSSDGYLHGRIGVSRAFGDWAWDEKEKCRGLLCLPEIFTAEVTSETEFLLLGCDGIFERMTTREAGQIVRRRLRTVGDAKDAASELVKHAHKRNGSDNLSALVVLFKRPPPHDGEAGRRAPRLFGAAIVSELNESTA